MGEIAKVNDIDIWWEEYGEKSNPTVLLIMGANANCMQWPNKFIEVLVANDLHVVRFDNRDVGKSTWFNKEPFVSKVARLLPLSISSKLINYVFTAMTDDEGNFLEALKENNNRAWFAENKSSHDDARKHVVEFTKILFERLSDLNHLDNQKVFRVYRDVQWEILIFQE